MNSFPFNVNDPDVNLDSRTDTPAIFLQQIRTNANANDSDVNDDDSYSSENGSLAARPKSALSYQSLSALRNVGTPPLSYGPPTYSAPQTRFSASPERSVRVPHSRLVSSRPNARSRNYRRVRSDLYGSYSRSVEPLSGGVDAQSDHPGIPRAGWKPLRGRYSLERCGPESTRTIAKFRAASMHKKPGC